MALPYLSQHCPTSSLPPLRHARAKSRVDASFMRHAQGQHGMITSLLRLPYELTATLFTSTSSAKKNVENMRFKNPRVGPGDFQVFIQAHYPI